MIKPLAPHQLYTACSLKQFDFDTTETLDDLTVVIGQDRAIQALHLGMNIQHDGYNLFVRTARSGQTYRSAGVFGKTVTHARNATGLGLCQ